MSTPKYDLLEIDGLKYKTQFTENLLIGNNGKNPIREPLSHTYRDLSSICM